MEALDKAAEIIGSQTALANLLAVSKGAVSQWKEPGRRVPAEYCPLIERATGGVVRCEDLRPDMAWDVLRLQAGIETEPAAAELTTQATTPASP
jgi:DNA-binding transcriptional regulator YdaS (Cro superfamily)